MIAPCFWFNGNATEAAVFYCNTFKGARITAKSPVVTEFEASGQRFICLNGGPQFSPNPSISFYYIAETEAEVDAVWQALEKEGTVMMPLDSYPWSKIYGWVQDKFGVTWQIALDNPDNVGQKFTPFLLFTGTQYGKAEEAMQWYASVFNDYKVDGILHYGKNEAPDEEGKVKHAQFSMNGQKFMVSESAHNNKFGFDEGISLTIFCDTQEEVDHYWEKLSKGGTEQMCGWVRDRYGITWQVIPTVLGKLTDDPQKAPKVAKAFLNIRKFDIEQLLKASEL